MSTIHSLVFSFFFFFSSRRRHTRCSRDWSSDVCSSDLVVVHRADADNVIAQRPEAQSPRPACVGRQGPAKRGAVGIRHVDRQTQILGSQRSEEHTSELQSRLHLVCRLLLEKKKNKKLL